MVSVFVDSGGDDDLQMVVVVLAIGLRANGDNKFVAATEGFLLEQLMLSWTGRKLVMAIVRNGLKWRDAVAWVSRLAQLLLGGESMTMKRVGGGVFAVSENTKTVTYHTRAWTIAANPMSRSFLSFLSFPFLPSPNHNESCQSCLV